MIGDTMAGIDDIVAGSVAAATGIVIAIGCGAIITAFASVDKAYSLLK